MNARNPLVRLLLALSLGALLLVGLAPGAPMQTSDPLAATPATTEVESAADVVIEDDVLLVATRKRHVRIKAWRYYGLPFLGPLRFISVDVNPTLRGSRSYKVILKVKHQGTWKRCAKARTTNRHWFDAATIGKAPHEMVFFDACKNKAPRKYRVIVPAQHGFLRTVTTVQPARF
jgi:hypothetical protein